MNSRLGVTATTDMAVLPGVLGCRPLRRTAQVSLGINPAAPRDGCQVARHLRGLATAIHEISGLGKITILTEVARLPRCKACRRGQVLSLLEMVSLKHF